MPRHLKLTVLSTLLIASGGAHAYAVLLNESWGRPPEIPYNPKLEDAAKNACERTARDQGADPPTSKLEKIMKYNEWGSAGPLWRMAKCTGNKLGARSYDPIFWFVQINHSPCPSGFEAEVIKPDPHVIPVRCVRPAGYVPEVGYAGGFGGGPGSVPIGTVISTATYGTGPSAGSGAGTGGTGAGSGKGSGSGGGSSSSSSSAGGGGGPGGGGGGGGGGRRGCQRSDGVGAAGGSTGASDAVPRASGMIEKVNVDCAVGNPINTATGAKRNIDVDYVGPGPFPLEVIRPYYFQTLPLAMPGLTTAAIDMDSGKNVAREVSIIGYRQLAKHNYDMRVIKQPNTDDIVRYKVVRPDGRVFPFRVAGSRIINDYYFPETLTALGSVTAPTGFELRNVDDTIETYDASGKLLSLTSREGLKITFEYIGDKLAVATDAFGRKINFLYSGDRWTGFIDPAGNMYTYGYLQYGQAGKMFRGEEIINSITYPDGTSRQYLFEDDKLWYAMTGIIDEKGVRYATYKYDSVGRAISSEHAGGYDKITVEYDPVNTTATIPWSGGIITNKITNALGLVSTRSYALYNGVFVPQTITEEGYTWRADYYAATRPHVEIDFRGQRVQTEYTADERKLVQSITRGMNSNFKSVTFDWHPTFNLPKQVNEANRSSAFDYYPNGSLKSLTVTDAQTKQTRQWVYTYTKIGQLESMTEPTGAQTRYTYDALGQLSTVTDALNRITLYDQYTANGLPQRLIRADGVSFSFAYDKRNRLQSVTVGGETTRYDYAKIGALERVTRPDGSWTRYTYNDAHYLSTITDSAGNQLTYERDLMGNVLKITSIDPKGQLAADISQIEQALQPLPISPVPAIPASE